MLINKISKTLFASLVFLGKVLPTEGVAQPLQYHQSPFGFHPASVNAPGYPDNGFVDAQNIGVRWHRPPAYAFWFAIKDVCRECTVLIGGAAGFPDNYVLQFDSVYLPILAELAGQYVDVFDFHWYGMAKGDYLLRDSVTGEEVYQHVRSILTANGFSPDLPIWITEMGSYSGDPVEPKFPFQTERQQASDYFKRFVYSLSHGVKKVFPAFGLMEGFIHNDGYFDHTGLIYNGQGSNDLGLGVKKLGYYTYKKMTEMLEASDWDDIQIAQEKDGIYIYKLTKQGKPIWVAWNDSSATKTIAISGITSDRVKVTEAVPKYESGKEVVDYTTAFRTDTLAVTNGVLMLTLGPSPVFVEPLELTSVEEEGENIPQEFRLYQNYPNPFNPTTTIHFSLPQREHVLLKVFAVNGREIASFVDAQLNAGGHIVQFEPHNLAGGIYFFSLTAGKFMQTRKAVLIK